MKLNISHPSNGSQKLIEIEDERKLRVFMDKRVCGVFPSFPKRSLCRCRPAMDANTAQGCVSGLIELTRDSCY